MENTDGCDDKEGEHWSRTQANKEEKGPKELTEQSNVSQV